MIDTAVAGSDSQADGQLVGRDTVVAATGRSVPEMASMGKTEAMLAVCDGAAKVLDRLRADGQVGG